MTRRVISQCIAVAAIFIVIAILFAYTPVDESQLARAELTELAIEVEVNGTLQAVESSLLGPPNIPGVYNFKISMMAPEGEEVSAGQPVLGFDTTELMRKLQSRQTEVESARKKIEKKKIDIIKQKQDEQLQLAEAQASLRRAKLKTATPSELVSDIEQQQAQLELELATTEVEILHNKMKATARSAQAELAGLQSDLDRASADVRQIESAIESMTRKAPRNGIVTYATDWRNEKKKVGDSVWVRSNVIEIPDLKKMKADGEVEEALAGKVAEGMNVTLHLDAHPDLEFTGSIVAVSRSVQKKSWRNPLKIVHVDIALDHTDPEKMRPGMRFKGSIQTDLLRDVLTIPASAVYTSDSGPIVFRRSFAGFEELELQLGPRNKERVVVVDGLEIGDLVSRRRIDS